MPDAIELPARERLLREAIAQFSRRGYDAVSTGDVAHAAGLTQSMVHYHFESKAKLWKAAIEKLMLDRGGAFPTRRMDLRDLDPLSRLKVLIRRFLSASAAFPELARIGVHEGGEMSPRLRWLIKRYGEAAYRLFDTAVSDAMEAGQIRRLPVRHVTMIIMNACAMPFTTPVWTEKVYQVSLRDEAEIEAYSDSMMSVMLHGILN